MGFGERDRDFDNWERKGPLKPRRQYVPTAADTADTWRTSSGNSAGAGPRQRLQLKPRTVSGESASSASGAQRSSSIFGSAKPVDTAKREKEIESKLDVSHPSAPRSDRRGSSSDKPVESLSKRFDVLRTEDDDDEEGEGEAKKQEEELKEEPKEEPKEEQQQSTEAPAAADDGEWETVGKSARH
jgi:translation initiation factor 4B